MSILCDSEILWLASSEAMIDPFVCDASECAGKVSYGLTSFGYDMRVADEWSVYSDGLLDVKSPASIAAGARHTIADWYIIDPGQLVLCRSLETFHIPDDISATVIGKSTYARIGLLVNCTPLEPAWRGHVTIELSNVGHRPIKVYANEGIAQVQFHRGKRPMVTYDEKHNAKYQDQSGIVYPRVK